MLGAKSAKITQSRLPVHLPAIATRLALLWTLFVAAVLFWCFRDHGYDDPYITYRYATNIARGMGFVYNAGDRVLSTTTPLYTLILAIFAWLGLDVPLASNLLSCVSISAGGFALWQFAQVWRLPLAGVAGLLLYPLYPLLITAVGSEMPLYVALALFGLLACVRGQYMCMALLLGCAALVRADGVLVGALAWLYVLWQGRPWPWRALVLYCALGLAWLLFAWLYFGSPLPVTLAAKRQQGAMAISRGFGAGLLIQAQIFWKNPLFFLHGALALAGLLYMLVAQRRWALLLGWDAAYALGYVVLGVSSYFWYYVPLVPGVVVLVALGVAALYALARWRAGIRMSVALAGAALLVLLFGQISTLREQAAHTDSRLAIYHAVGDWLRVNTPPDASVGTLEVGIIGYYAQRRMIDFAGLIQPITAGQMRVTSTYDDLTFWATHHFHPDYVVLQDGLFPRLEQDPAFGERCHAAKDFADDMYAHRLVLYRCAW